MNNNLESMNYYSEKIIKESELDYQLELHGEPRHKYVIGCDFGLINTNITITKIIPEGINVVRNITLTRMQISEQSLLVKQLWKDYNQTVAILTHSAKVGFAMADSLSILNCDPRDEKLLPPIVDIDDDETLDAIRIIKIIDINHDKFYMAIKMRQALEDNILHFPNSRYDDIEMSQLKKEICDIKVKIDNNGTTLNFKRDENKINEISRFTSALLSINGALEYYNKNYTY